METFNTLHKPFCLYYITTDKHASPSKTISDIIQTTIHEEYGHCVNLLNSALNKKINILEKLNVPLNIPITEGISFFRELEATHLFKEIAQKKQKNAQEKKFVKKIEKHIPFEE